MSIQGTRNKRGSVDLDRSAVSRGIALQIVFGALVVPLGAVVGVQPGFLLLPTTLLVGCYVGLRSDNWGDEYMDGGAMGVVGSIAAALIAGALSAGYAFAVGGETPTAAFLSSMLTVGLVVVVLIPLLGVFGAAGAWYAAKQFGR